MTREEKRAIKQKQREEYVANVINYNRVAAIELANRAKEKKPHEGAYVSIQQVNKIYDNLVQAVYDFSLDIKQNEFIVFVGPSGCGKSTTLRMIAGLEEITAGNLFIDGEYANSLPPKDRNIAMVFQSYALYPHMSVYNNMAFALQIKTYDMPVFDENGQPVMGVDKKKIETLEKQIKDLDGQIANIKKYNFQGQTLELLKSLETQRDSLLAQLEVAKNTNVHVTVNRKYTKQEIDDAVAEAAKILQITEYLDRKPKALSGGQRQRVALGRAIVKKAKLFLMDEPLSNLDAKLRVSMRSEIKRIHQQIGATTIYVTHDQTEAMTMADRIVIMNQGYIQQVGHPKEIYDHPANTFVATFIGSPAMNIINTQVKDGVVDFKEFGQLKLPAESLKQIKQTIEQKIKAFEDFEANGLNEEYEKEILVKKESIFLEIKNGSYRSKQEGDPLDNIQLDEDEKKMCEELFNKQLAEIKEKKDAYQKMLNEGVYDVIFGIRPEDAFLAEGNIPKEASASSQLKTKVTISELLGNEYFVHADFAGVDFVLKTGSANAVDAGKEINMVFDMNKIHLFDIIDKNIIL